MSAPPGPEHPADPGDQRDVFAGPDWREASPPVAAPGQLVRSRRRQVTRKRLRLRRRTGLVMVLFGGIIVLGGIWLIVTGLLARGQLSTVRSEVRQLHTQLAAGDLDQARATARQLAVHAHRAHEYTAGPAWAIAAAVPAGGAPFETVRTITAETDLLGQQVLPRVITATRTLDPSALRRSDGSIDVSRIASIAPALHRADMVMTRATDDVADQPSSTWLGFVDTARADLLTQLTSLGNTLHSADLAARIAPVMLGEHGTKRYFVAFQNNAEARGTGGLPGAFAIVRADHGTLSFERFESDATLAGVRSGVSFGAQYRANWLADHPTVDYFDSNVSPNFPYAAQIWMGMWHNYAHERLDGAVAVDPQALSYLLAVTGPARLPGGTLVTSANVVQLTQQTVYDRYPSAELVPQRKRFLLRIARSVSETVLGSKASTTALVQAADRAAVQRRLLLYSADRSAEAGLQQTSLSGAIASTTAPYTGLVINNAGGNKLDYYLDRSVSWKRTGCGAMRDVTATVRLTNDAPADITGYAAERNDHPDYPTKRGDNRLSVYYYATDGAVLRSVTLDGRKQAYYGGTERGHPIIGLDVEMPRGQPRTIVYHLLEPAGSGRVMVLRQPLVRPLKVSVVDDHSCG